MLDEARDGLAEPCHRRPRGRRRADDAEIRERMSGNICRCGAYANIVAAIAGGRPAMRPFAYERATDADGAVAALADAPDALPRRRHQPPRPDEARGRDARGGWSTSAACRWTRSRRRPTAACASARACATATSPPTRASASATRCSRRRCWPAPPGSCATRRPPAATCCSARAAPTSTTSTSRATSATPGSGCAAREGEHRNLAILGHSPSTASPPTRPTWPSRWPRSTPSCTSRAPTAAARVPLADLHRLPGDDADARHRAASRAS